MKRLVIVESPTKAKTISRFLGKDYFVESSYGHVRDLPKNKMGVDTSADFEPSYVVPVKAKPRITKLKELAKKSDMVYFATDEDREGEAIAWHLNFILKPKKSGRIVFHEITKSAIQHALEEPRQIDEKLFEAQQARRILDRLVGYELSPFLWKKIRYGLSAGRVQSVAVRLIVDREREIQAFKQEEYWTIEVDLQTMTGSRETFQARVIKKSGKLLPTLGIQTQDAAQAIVADLETADFVVSDVQKVQRQKQPPAPFTTSTLQQEAAHVLGYSAKQTMLLAQQLYEGIHLGEGTGQTGLITYMRTDSLNLSQEFLGQAREFITATYGANYAPAQQKTFKNKSKYSQEAHEAIRPTLASRTPEDVASYLDDRQLKLYRLIWSRGIACQMSPSMVDATRADIAAGDYTLRATGSIITFDGFLKVYNPKGKTDSAILPPLAPRDQLKRLKTTPSQHFTEPPARFTEATLVKALEEQGVGRPSTYASIINTIQVRKYVEKLEKRFHPTETGTLVNDLLTKHFPSIVDVHFTARVEEDLDEIAHGLKKWVPVIHDFYDPFKKQLKEKEKEVSKEELTQEKTTEICEKCGSPMVIKFGRFGKFLACSTYPTCKNTKPIGEDKKLQEEVQASHVSCTNCGAPMVVKHGRFGAFLGCSRYPECKTIMPIEKKTGVACPECGKGEIIEKRSKRGKIFFACNKYPSCKFALWSKPTGEKCPTCNSLLVFAAKQMIKCSSKTCDFAKPTTESGE